MQCLGGFGLFQKARTPGFVSINQLCVDRISKDHIAGLKVDLKVSVRTDQDPDLGPAGKNAFHVRQQLSPNQ